VPKSDAAPVKPGRAKRPPKTSKPELKPLDSYLAELLNPAINRERERAAERAEGFGERPKETYVHGDATDVEPALAKKLGLRGPDDGPDVNDDGPLDVNGVSATVDALSKLLESGNPLFKHGKLWTPHRPPRPEKSEGGIRFNLSSEYQPAGDQPKAIAELVAGIDALERDQVLLGVTGSGKTYTMAQVIARTQRPALVLAPNKTLAAQLYGEFKSFFPDNAVEYFVSYYDYYQPEAYVPRTDVYVEKESSINEQIDRMRHSATRALLERDDVIIVASVSCIYGIGSVETYTAMTFSVKAGERIEQRQLVADLVALHYKRTSHDFQRGTFRVRGDSIELFPAHLEDRAWRISLFGDEVESIVEFDPLTGQKTSDLSFVKIYANSHYVTPKPTLQQAVKSIKEELRQRLDELNRMGRLLESQRLEQRCTFDIEMIEATGACNGIENYSLPHRPQARRAAADPVRVPAGQRHRLHRRKPCDGAADRRHVPGRLPPEGDAGRIWFPAAVLHGQPAAALRGMGGHAPADGACLGHPCRLGVGTGPRRLR